MSAVRFAQRTDRRPGRSRGQCGFTLVEVLLATAITSIVMLPLIGWAAFALRQETKVKETDAAAAALGLVQGYLPRDVGSARTATAAASSTDDCAGVAGDPRGGGGTVRLVTMPAVGPRAVWATSVGADGRTSLWRRQCAAAGGPVLGATRLVSDVRSVSVTCSDRNGRTDDPCGQVLLAIELVGTGGPYNVAAARRIDGDLSSRFGRTGNLAPTAVIDASDATGFRPSIVALDGTRSIDPEGSALTYSWDFADGGHSALAAPTHTWSDLGSYTVTLTVTDTGGATSTTYVVVTVGNRLPSVVADSDLSVVTPGTVVTFTSAGTTDPDPGGRIVSWSWNFGDGSTPSTAPNPTHSYAALGTYSAELTVVDDDGGSASANVTVTVASSGTDPGSESAPTSTIDPTTESGTDPATDPTTTVGP